MYENEATDDKGKGYFGVSNFEEVKQALSELIETIYLNAQVQKLSSKRNIPPCCLTHVSHGFITTHIWRDTIGVFTKC
ncbi:hypothetical protein NMG60_11029576 [Bertholletia excelsa]